MRFAEKSRIGPLGGITCAGRGFSMNHVQKGGATSSRLEVSLGLTCGLCEEMLPGRVSRSRRPSAGLGKSRPSRGEVKTFTIASIAKGRARRNGSVN